MTGSATERTRVALGRGGRLAVWLAAALLGIGFGLAPAGRAEMGASAARSGYAADSLTPDATVASAEALVALMQSWQADWKGTVPAGKTAADARVIGIGFSSDRDIDLSGYDFSETAGRRRVTLRMVGGFTAAGSGNATRISAPYAWRGDLNLKFSRNIRVTLMEFLGDERIKVGGSEDITIERVYLKGNYGDWTTGAGAPTQNFGFLIDKNRNLRTKRLVFRDNLVQGFRTAGVQLWGNLEDSVIEGNVLDIMAHDDFKLNNGLKRNIVHARNWGSRIRTGPPGSSFHEDFMQWEGKGAVVRDWLSEGNVMFRGRWYGAAGGVHQGFFGGGVTVQGAMFRSNICVTNTYCIDIPKSKTSNVAAFDNSFLAERGVGGNLRTIVNRSVTRSGGNLTTTPGKGNGKEGPGGINVTIGPEGAKFDALLKYVSQVPAPDAMIEALYPPPGSPASWTFPGRRVGAWRRLKEIFVDGIHPENVGWPVAPIWRARWNANASPLVPTTYTGHFDADGRNR